MSSSARSATGSTPHRPSQPARRWPRQWRPSTRLPAGAGVPGRRCALGRARTGIAVDRLFEGSLFCTVHVPRSVRRIDVKLRPSPEARDPFRRIVAPASKGPLLGPAARSPRNPRVAVSGGFPRELTPCQFGHGSGAWSARTGWSYRRIGKETGTRRETLARHDPRRAANRPTRSPAPVMTLVALGLTVRKSDQTRSPARRRGRPGLRAVPGGDRAGGGAGPDRPADLAGPL